MWEFTDDTGQAVRTDRVPVRVVAYARAGAALDDLGIRPVAVYGSGHDDGRLDPAKSGALAAAGVPYLGPGKDLTEEALLAASPDLVVDLTYDEKSPYALERPRRVPLVALSVGGAPLPAILARFGELAAGLRDGTAPEPGGAAELAAAEALLGAGAGAGGARVLALSGAGSGQVHLARPEAWPELRHLAGLGVRLLDPGPGPGTGWLTTDWDHAAGLRPDLVLADNRANAQPVPEGRFAGVPVEPWNPETPPSPAAYAHFFRALAGRLSTLSDG
ncbi:ABC transporter substrate-binding protein [Streptomyces sp. LP05-1]|uniref:ABC transporter substrate-binding protein n=1 Tax=Streptomyces pyxinae TaxID=2970734 RepID=A0ABT2CQA3_9ACTN|nr:ABC transporter substrate-binding protein [Streptomyces sp. LP05-1]